MTVQRFHHKCPASLHSCCSDWIPLLLRFLVPSIFMAKWQSVEVLPLEHRAGSPEGHSSASGIQVLNTAESFTHELQSVRASKAVTSLSSYN